MVTIRKKCNQDTVAQFHSYRYKKSKQKSNFFNCFPYFQNGFLQCIPYNDQFQCSQINLGHAVYFMACVY